jgi:hypothetical protein
MAVGGAKHVSDSLYLSLENNNTSSPPLFDLHSKSIRKTEQFRAWWMLFHNTENPSGHVPVPFLKLLHLSRSASVQLTVSHTCIAKTVKLSGPIPVYFWTHRRLCTNKSEVRMLWWWWISIPEGHGCPLLLWLYGISWSLCELALSTLHAESVKETTRILLYSRTIAQQYRAWRMFEHYEKTAVTCHIPSLRGSCIRFRSPVDNQSNVGHLYSLHHTRREWESSSKNPLQDPSLYTHIRNGIKPIVENRWLASPQFTKNRALYNASKHTLSMLGHLLAPLPSPHVLGIHCLKPTMLLCPGHLHSDDTIMTWAEKVVETRIPVLWIGYGRWDGPWGSGKWGSLRVTSVWEFKWSLVCI